MMSQTNETIKKETRTEKRARLKAELDPKLKFYRGDWKKLSGAFVRVELSISFWRGKRTLTLADFGLDTAPREVQEQLKKRMTLGQHVLMREQDHRRLTSRASRARSVVYSRSLSTPWGQGLMLEREYPEVREQLSEIRQEFEEVTARVVDEYADMVEQVRRDARRKAHVAWALRRGVPAESILLPADEEFDDAQAEAWEADAGDATIADVAFEAFRNAYVARVLERLPDVETIRQSFSFEWTPTYIEPPATGEKGRALAELEARHEALMLEIDKIDAAAEREKRAAELRDLKERIALKREIDDERRAKVQQEFDRQVEKTLTDFSGRICSSIAVAAGDLAESIRKNEFVHPRAADSFRETVRRAREWNRAVLENPELERVCEVALATASAVGSKVDVGTATLALDDVECVMRGRLYDLARTARVEIGFEAPDAVDDVRIKTARGRLALDDDEAADVVVKTGGKLALAS
jgi:hypothetical protein